MTAVGIAGAFLNHVPVLGDQQVVIAVLDGTVDRSHPSLIGARLIQLQSVIPPLVAGGQASAHGTHVASIIFGQPGSGVEGVAAHCTGLLIPIFSDHQQRGELACSQLDLARAILLAVENGAHIINISAGQLAHGGEPEPVLAQAIERCAAHNVLIVAAAGNEGCDCLHVPAAVGTVLAVGAMDAEGRPLPSSNWGANYQVQGILAPGKDVPGARIGGGVVCRSGTSFAAPCVSGVAAQLIALQIVLGRAPDPHAVRAALLASASPCIPAADDCRKILSGRLNVPEATKLLAGGVHHVSDTATAIAEPIVANAITPSENVISAAEDAIMPPPANARSAMALSGIAPDRGIRMSGESGLAGAVRASSDGGSLPPLTQLRGEIGQITPSCGCGGDKGGCGCGGGENCTCGGSGAVQKPQLVYALGHLGYDFATEARRDSFVQAMQARNVGNHNPHDPAQLLAYLALAPYDASSLIWTLNIDATPIYAIQPAGAFVELVYERLREFLEAQLAEGTRRAEIVSIPGVIAGSVPLMSGQVVPVVVPALRGMYAWAPEPLARHVLGPAPKKEDERTLYERHLGGLGDFLNRVYFELRNLGVTGAERALNYAATNAMQIAQVIEKATRQGLDLDRLQVVRSPVCRPDSDCYDVELSFFNANNMNVASRIFRFTVDVSDVIPVSIGLPRDWTRRG
ncbi:MAG TPA: PatA/PatG family cyanobactin maturation protease [Tardiphaga sp.]